MAYGDAICGGASAPMVQISGGSLSGGLPFFITDTDDALRVVDMTAQAQDYDPGNSFLINIETDAPIVVQLESGNDFVITQTQATAYLGQWYPAILTKVYKTAHGVTTTGTFSVGR